MSLPELLLFMLSCFFAAIAIVSILREKRIADRYRGLVSQHARFIDTTSHITPGVCIIDTERRITFLNPSIKSLLSLPDSHTHLTEILQQFPNPFTLSNTIDEALTLHRRSEERDIKLKQKTVHIQIHPLKQALGSLTGVALVITDAAEERSASEMKEAFTKVISHELRSPLTTIRAASQFLRMQSGRINESEQAKLLTMIDEQTEKLLYEIELILDAAKLETGEFELHQKEENIEEFIGTQLSKFLPEMTAKHLTLLTRIEPNIPTVLFDKKYLAQALFHVVTNSIKFTSPGGEVMIDATRDDESILISIKDTGSGIPQEKQRKLFSRFSHISSPSENIGIGLGLYLTKGIVEAHGGSIALTSEVGVGTTVTIRLPLGTVDRKKLSPLPKQDAYSLVN